MLIQKGTNNHPGCLVSPRNPPQQQEPSRSSDLRTGSLSLPW